MTNTKKVQAVLHATGGEIEYTYPSGQVSTVTLAVAGLGTKRIRVATLPPEVSYDEMQAALTPHGKIVDIQTEKWSNNYRYAVDNGVRQVTILMTRHVPSHLTVAGYRVLLSYEGQPVTCYGCGAIEHLYHDSPVRHKSSQDRLTPAQQTYAKIAFHCRRHRSYGHYELRGGRQPTRQTRRTGSRGSTPRDTKPETPRHHPHATDHSPKREGDEGIAENTTTPSITHDKKHPQTDKPGGPKRNKKFKTNGNDEQTHERTRRAANRGKL